MLLGFLGIAEIIIGVTDIKVPFAIQIVLGIVSIALGVGTLLCFSKKT